MSDATALAEARYRRRCAVQAVNNALHELRVAGGRLAALEGRAPMEITSPLLPVPCEPGRQGLAEEAHDDRASKASSALCVSDSPAADDAFAAERVAEGPAADLPPAAGPERCCNCSVAPADYFTPGGNGICAQCRARFWQQDVS